jgi:hypothetical protein
MNIGTAPAKTRTGVSGEVAALWVLTGLFVCRVSAQILVAFFHVTFLPPMAEWYSGLLPYPILLPVQLVMIAGMTKLDLDAANERGALGRARPRWGRFLLGASVVYAGGMVVRYFVSGHLHPERQFWPPGSIPIIFHFVLAGYLYTLSRVMRGLASAR